jgi:CHC2 zinc finger
LHPVAQYIYRDAAGQPLRKKERYEPKWFAWFSFDPTVSAWRRGAADSARTLYHLERLAAHRPKLVISAEGEKDVDNLIALGFHAVTSGGAGSWGPQHSQQLLEHGCRLCAVMLDNDDGGRDHGYQVARCNLELDITTRLIVLPDLLEHEDVSDWISRGGRYGELYGLIRRTPDITLDQLPAPKPKATPRAPDAYPPYDTRLNRIYFERLPIPTHARGSLHCLCPFHADHETLSFHLNLQKGIWKCFGCGLGGGVAEFYRRSEMKEGRILTLMEARRHVRALCIPREGARFASREGAARP